MAANQVLALVHEAGPDATCVRCRTALKGFKEGEQVGTIDQGKDGRYSYRVGAPGVVVRVGDDGLRRWDHRTLGEVVETPCDQAAAESETLEPVGASSEEGPVCSRQGCTEPGTVRAGKTAWICARHHAERVEKIRAAKRELGTVGKLELADLAGRLADARTAVEEAQAVVDKRREELRSALEAWRQGVATVEREAEALLGSGERRSSSWRRSPDRLRV